jgi:N utilization substance protein A
LFEQEIPVFDGLIMVKNVVRIPGEKQKAVETYDDRIDPVGACGYEGPVFMVLFVN